MSSFDCAVLYCEPMTWLLLHLPLISFERKHVSIHKCSMLNYEADGVFDWSVSSVVFISLIQYMFSKI